MNKKRFFGFLSLTLVLSGLSFGGATKIKADDTFNGKTFNYAHTSDESKVAYIDGETLIRKLKPNQQISDAEINFCKANYRVRYDKYEVNHIGDPYNFGHVTDKVSGINTYYVEAFKDSEFEPLTLTVGNDNPVNFEAINYQTIAQYQGDSIEGGTIKYKHTVTIDKFAANEILNGAFNALQKEIALDNEYKNYQAYLSYAQRVSDYNAYLKEKEIVNIKLSEIEKYNQDHQDYQDDLDSYNQYLLDVQEYSRKVEAYKTYLDDKYAYDQIKSEIDAQVEAYNKDMQLVNYQFASMDLFYNSDLYPNITPEKTIYKCLYTDAVAQVTNPDNAWILSAGAGVSESIFTSAASATNKLKKILTEYKDKYLIDKNGNYVLDDGGQKILKTDADNYKLYIKYFNSLYTNVTKLTKFLEFLFTNTNIRNEMDSRGKTEKYKDLLSELIYISNLFTYPNNLTAYNNTTKTIGFDYNLGGQTVCERLGLAVPTIEKKMQPLSSYPVDPAVVYGTEPSITDEKYGLSDDDFENNEIKKVTEVTKPIEPLLSDYGLTQNDLDNTPVLPTLGISLDYFIDRDESKGLIKYDEPATIPTGRHENDQILNDLFVSKNNIAEQTEYSTSVDFECFEDITINTAKVAEKNIAVMWIIKGNNETSVHEVAFFDKGGSPILMHEIPPEALGGTDYKYFNKWIGDEELSDLASYTGGSINLTADFVTGALTKYSIHWYDIEDKSQSLFDNYGYQNFKPSLTDNDGKDITPYKVSNDLSIRYEFENYVDVNGEILTLGRCENMSNDGENINIYLKFKPITLHTVTFTNNINSDSYTSDPSDAGVRVYYDAQNIAPLMDSVDTNQVRESYEFSHWEDSNGTTITLPIEVSATEDITVKAIYKKTNYYKVTFKDENNDVLSSRYYKKEQGLDGEIPVEPETPTKSFDDNSHYSFAGWDNLVSAVTSDSVYVATYSSTKIIPNANIVRADSKLIITPETATNSIDVSTLSSLLGKGYVAAPTTIKFSDGDVNLSENQLKQFYINNVKTISLTKVEENNETKFTLTVKDENNENVNFNATCVASVTGDFNHLRGYAGETQVALSRVSEKVSFNISTAKDVVIAEYFKVNIDSYSNASFVINGVAFDQVNVPEFKKGTEVTVDLTASSGYKVDKIIALDGNDTEITSKTIGENDSTSITFSITKDAFIKADTSRIMLVVNFYVDGEIYKTENVPVNTILILPTPIKEPTETINFVFDKWEELEEGQTTVVITESIDYHAHFIEYLLTNTDDAMESSKKVMTTIAIASLCTIGAGFLFGLIFLIAKKDKDDEDDTNVKTKEKKHEKKI